MQPSANAKPPQLYTCSPEAWTWLPKPLRLVLGWVSILLFCWSFAAAPLCLLLLLPITWRVAPICAGAYLAAVTLSLLAGPAQERPFVRRIGQLWYECLGFRCNLDAAKIEEMAIRTAKGEQFILAMHPHGILPLQAILWAAYCDQYLRHPIHAKDSVYGFGAAADIVGKLPFLRQLMGWLTSGSATYSVLKKGLTEGYSPHASLAGRKVRHLYLLPGGVAEVFTSQVGRDAVVFKKRRGLCRLALETGASLVPVYVFGGTDFFYNLATAEGWLSRLSRRFRMGLTLPYGRFGLPIPMVPASGVSLVLGEPIQTGQQNGGPMENPPDEAVDELHAKYLEGLNQLYEEYKGVAGRPQGKLEIF